MLAGAVALIFMGLWLKPALGQLLVDKTSQLNRKNQIYIENSN